MGDDGLGKYFRNITKMTSVLQKMFRLPTSLRNTIPTLTTLLQSRLTSTPILQQRNNNLYGQGARCMASLLTMHENGPHQKTQEAQLSEQKVRPGATEQRQRNDGLHPWRRPQSSGAQYRSGPCGPDTRFTGSQVEVCAGVYD